MSSVELNFRNVSWAVGAIAALLAGASAATWAVRGDVLQALREENATFKQSNDWGLVETLKELRAAASELNLALEERNQLDGLVAKVATLEKSLAVSRDREAALQQELASIVDKVSSLQEDLSRAYIDQELVRVAVADSVELVKNTFVLGLAHVYSSWVTVNINERSHDIQIGNAVYFDYGGRTCSVRLMRIDRESGATFGFSCAL